MANPKRPEKTKFKVTKPPADLVFTDDFRKDSVYTVKLLEAVNSDQVIEVTAGDSYMLNQLKKAAKKIPLRLVYAKSADSIFVKPIKPSEHEERLVVLLREPRSLTDLQSVTPRLELHLEDTLQRMAGQGTAHQHKGKWVLTERGMDLLPQTRSARAVA